MRWNFVNYRYDELVETMSGARRKFRKTFGYLWNVKSSRRKLIAMPLALIGFSLIYTWTFTANSCALFAFLCLVTFDVLILFGDLISQGYQQGVKQSSFNFGEARIEVLIHFSILCFTVVLNIWVILISCNFMLNRFYEDIEITWFIPTALIGGMIHFFLSFNNNPLHKVYKISGTQTILQQEVQALARLGTTSGLITQSPLALLGAFVMIILIGLNFILQSGSRWVDFIGGGLVSFATLDATYPLCLYTGQVLLQSIPKAVQCQLEQVLQEALTIDGVLEFRNELFWTLSYGQLAGTVHVRVRRDANEQSVLTNIYEKLQTHVSHLTIQITKDEFSRRMGQFPIHREGSAPPTVVVTIQEDLSPILRGPDMAKHVIYSTGSSSSSSHHPKNSISHCTIPIQSFMHDESLNTSSSSSIFHPVTPIMASSARTHAHMPHVPPIANVLLRQTNQKNNVRNNFNLLNDRESISLLKETH